ncbi:MAG: hypothetical protein ACI8WB_002112 [Phenylobacterium sp.]|jgi:hypothetical protein
MMEKENFATITVQRKWFGASQIDFTTSFGDDYQLLELVGFRLDKAGKPVYCGGDSVQKPLYKGQPVTQRHPVVKPYPFAIQIPGYADIQVCQPKWHQPQWTVVVDQQIKAKLEFTSQGFSRREHYKLLITDKVDQDLMLFVLMLMFERLNDSSGS